MQYYPCAIMMATTTPVSAFMAVFRGRDGGDRTAPSISAGHFVFFLPAGDEEAGPPDAPVTGPTVPLLVLLPVVTLFLPFGGDRPPLSRTRQQLSCSREILRFGGAGKRGESDKCICGCRRQCGNSLHVLLSGKLRPTTPHPTPPQFLCFSYEYCHCAPAAAATVSEEKISSLLSLPPGPAASWHWKRRAF